MGYSLPDLPYGYDALEPHIDARTMEIHHTKHHQAYINNVNAALEGTEYADKCIVEVMRNLGSLPADMVADVIDQLEGGDAIAAAHRSTPPLVMRGVDLTAIVAECLGECVELLDHRAEHRGRRDADRR